MNFDISVKTKNKLILGPLCIKFTFPLCMLFGQANYKNDYKYFIGLAIFLLVCFCFDSIIFIRYKKYKEYAKHKEYEQYKEREEYKKYKKLYEYIKKVNPQDTMAINYFTLRPEVVEVFDKNNIEVKERIIYFKLNKAIDSNKLNVLINDEMKCSFDNHIGEIIPLTIPKVFYEDCDINRLSLNVKLKEEGKENELSVSKKKEFDNILEFGCEIKPKEPDDTLYINLKIENGFIIGNNNSFIIDPYLLDSNKFKIILEDMELIENYECSLYKYSMNNSTGFLERKFEFCKNYRLESTIPDHSKDNFYILSFKHNK